MTAKQTELPRFSLYMHAEESLNPTSHSMIALNKFSQISDKEMAMLISYQQYLEKHDSAALISFISRPEQNIWIGIVCGKNKKKSPDPYYAPSLLELLDFLEGKLFSHNWEEWKRNHKEIFSS